MNIHNPSGDTLDFIELYQSYLLSHLIRGFNIPDEYCSKGIEEISVKMQYSIHSYLVYYFRYHPSFVGTYDITFFNSRKCLLTSFEMRQTELCCMFI